MGVVPLHHLVQNVAEVRPFDVIVWSWQLFWSPWRRRIEPFKLMPVMPGLTLRSRVVTLVVWRWTMGIVVPKDTTAPLESHLVPVFQRVYQVAAPL